MRGRAMFAAFVPCGAAFASGAALVAMVALGACDAGASSADDDAIGCPGRNFDDRYTEHYGDFAPAWAPAGC